MIKKRSPFESMPLSKRSFGLNLEVRLPQKGAAKAVKICDGPIINPVQIMVSF